MKNASWRLRTTVEMTWGETATLLSKCLFTLKLCGGGFAPRQSRGFALYGAKRRSLRMINTIMSSRQQFLKNLYEAFNKREFEKILSMMQPDVKWANGMEGGFVYGRDAVGEYWRKQFENIQSQLEPVDYETDENNRNIVTVHLIVRDLEGNLLLEKTVQQIFTIENDLISLFEIGDAEPLQRQLKQMITSINNGRYRDLFVRD